MSKLDEIADYAEHHDFAAEMEQGSWESDTDADPMITTSVRLPKSLLDWVRRSAAAQHVRPSVLIRQWIEQHRDAAEAEARATSPHGSSASNAWSSATREHRKRWFRTSWLTGVPGIHPIAEPGSTP